MGAWWERLRTYQVKHDHVFITAPPAEAVFELEPSYAELQDAVDEMAAHVLRLEREDG